MAWIERCLGVSATGTGDRSDPINATAVRTPISQAVEEGRLSRGELREFMRRSDRIPLLHLALWLSLTATTGGLVSLANDTPWFVLAMFKHGVVLVHYFSLQHECTHYAVFRTRRYNDWVGAACGLLIGLAPKFFRYEHCDHHTWTQIPGRDPEQIPLPATLAGYLWYLSSGPYWWAKAKELGRHAAGHLSPADKVFVPKPEFAGVVREARIMLSIYAAILLTMVTTQWWAPMWYWIVPVLLGEPVMRAIRMTEHVGMPPVDDMRRNTRTNLISTPLRWLCWNMNYHAEHHYASSVPYHALPRLHRRLSGELPVEHGGYLGAHRDILTQLCGRQPRADAISAVGCESAARSGTGQAR